ncbi:hypothetical protein LSCM1_00261 [Leishmania martiniquensis]|uniref:F-box domain-containing protein n=1 Tax=Leishmania martiniquensis TaxID=1580590 RepID=A0A836GSB9_9TRYP|nr:hypothetical protein LSCM1_00261 [Leishmania martiniquensis]
MLAKGSDCAKSKQQQQQQQQTPEGIKSPCTLSPECISYEERMGDRPASDNCEDLLDWSPQTPETLPVSVEDRRVTMVAGMFATETMCEGAATACLNAKRLAGGAAVAVGAAIAAAPQKAQERGPLAPIIRKPLHGASGAVSSSTRHVDVLGGLPSSTSSSSSSSGTVRSAVAAGRADGPLSPPLRGVFFPSVACDAATTASLVTRISSYCDVITLVQLMRVDRLANLLATSDDVWKPLLASMNLSPLLSAYERGREYYSFFVQDVITTRALHGHYTFRAADPASGSRGSVSTTSGSRSAGANCDHASRDDDSFQEDIFNIASLQLLISAASLGQSNHRIGRVQLLLTYKNESMEVLQGSCRFSVHRRCFSLCCSAFGTVKRGPVFTVAVATVTKPWANEDLQHFSEHKNGIRLVMTPVLWEGQSPGSQITENDILVVSRAKPTPSSARPAAGSASASSSLGTPTASHG